MDEQNFIPIILGTNRKGRQSEAVARFLFEQITTHQLFATELIDVRDFPWPTDDYGPGLTAPEFETYRATIARAHGLIIVSPEYNHSFPGILKSLLDVAYDEYNHKPLGICGTSSGVFAGARMIESLLSVVKALGMQPLKKDLMISKVQEHFTAEGELSDPDYQKRYEDFLTRIHEASLRYQRAWSPN